MTGLSRSALLTYSRAMLNFLRRFLRLSHLVRGRAMVYRLSSSPAFGRRALDGSWAFDKPFRLELPRTTQVGLHADVFVHEFPHGGLDLRAVAGSAVGPALSQRADVFSSKSRVRLKLLPSPRDLSIFSACSRNNESMWASSLHINHVYRH